MAATLRRRWLSILLLHIYVVLVVVLVAAGCRLL
jgi:hypothetical protein